MALDLDRTSTKLVLFDSLRRPPSLFEDISNWERTMEQTVTNRIDPRL